MAAKSYRTQLKAVTPVTGGNAVQCRIAIKVRRIRTLGDVSLWKVEETIIACTAFTATEEDIWVLLPLHTFIPENKGKKKNISQFKGKENNVS